VLPTVYCPDKHEHNQRNLQPPECPRRLRGRGFCRPGALRSSVQPSTIPPSIHPSIALSIHHPSLHPSIHPLRLMSSSADHPGRGVSRVCVSVCDVEGRRCPGDGGDGCGITTVWASSSRQPRDPPPPGRTRRQEAAQRHGL